MPARTVIPARLLGCRQADVVALVTMPASGMRRGDAGSCGAVSPGWAVRREPDRRVRCGQDRPAGR